MNLCILYTAATDSTQRYGKITPGNPRHFFIFAPGFGHFIFALRAAAAAPQRAHKIFTMLTRSPRRQERGGVDKNTSPTSLIG